MSNQTGHNIKLIQPTKHETSCVDNDEELTWKLFVQNMRYIYNLL